MEMKSRPQTPHRPGFAAAALLPFLLAALAGCVGDSGGSAHLEFDGTGNGSHSDETECDAEGTLIGTGRVEAGQVVVRVVDGDGNELFDRTFDGGVNMESEGLDGAAGDWHLSATRTSDGILQEPFSGSYDFKLGC